MSAPNEFVIPPQAIDAEQSVLGSLLLDARAWERVADVLTDADFFTDSHRRIWRHVPWPPSVAGRLMWSP
jgi:replicative DNA helicase